MKFSVHWVEVSAGEAETGGSYSVEVLEDHRVDLCRERNKIRFGWPVVSLIVVVENVVRLLNAVALGCESQSIILTKATDNWFCMNMKHTFSLI